MACGLIFLLIALRPLPVHFDLMPAFSDENVPHKHVHTQIPPTLTHCRQDLPSSYLLWLSLSHYSVPSPWSWRLASFCYCLILCFFFFISAFFAPKSVTSPCYSFCSSFHQQKLQNSKYTVRGGANSCFFFIFSLYYCTESPFLKHQALQPLSVFQALL